ncbi:hypothetical protein [Streptomyces sp. NPDC047028]|uniref:hypothetical protein n=1 Tax=Streptomyces sp. NPDC047028 TaxID=3155793 RepID=UPI0033F86B67
MSTPAVSPASPSPVSTAPSASSASTAPSNQVSTTKFGDTFAYQDGLQVKVEGPAVFTPSDVDAGATPGDKTVKLAVTLTNGTSGVFDASGVTVRATAGDNGRQVGTIAGEGLGIDFAGTIVAGASQTVTFGFDIPKDTVGNKFDVEVDPDFIGKYVSEHWVGTLP